MDIYVYIYTYTNTKGEMHQLVLLPIYDVGEHILCVRGMFVYDLHICVCVCLCVNGQLVVYFFLASLLSDFSRRAITHTFRVAEQIARPDT